MHGMNNNYGHKSVFSSYVGTIDDLPVWGAMQHGWNAYDGFSPYDRLTKTLPLLVWSSQCLSRIQIGRKVSQFKVTGAPFAYLMQNSPHLWPKPGPGTIAFPHHTAETEGIAPFHQEYAAELLETEKRPVTVCLYWLDYEQVGVREVYESYGHSVVSVGSSRHNRLYLANYLKLLEGKDRVVSNILSTATIYSASIGIPTSIYGVNMGASPQAITEYADSHSLIHLVGNQYEVTTKFARSELGWDELLSQQDLSKLLGWTGVRRTIGFLLLFLYSSRRFIKGLG